ncbi:MAG: NAD+ synthase [Candidatus Levybacteria bacterium]|nr:NAD+ synthase [Candidatus Levybacteria bacterium]
MSLLTDPQKEEERIIEFIRQILRKTDLAGIVVALSGGVDSATVLTLVVRAIGRERTHVLLLPCGNLNDNGMKRAKNFVTYLGLPDENIQLRDISPVVTAASRVVGLEEDGVRKGNIMARSRMIVLYDYARKHTLLVSGTENRSEFYLGYFTRFGDEASDFEPIRHLYKTQVYQLAKHLEIPRGIINAKPTANLWKDQTDEEEFGFSYKDADLVLEQYFDELRSVDAIEKEFSHAGKIIEYVKKNHFKHEVPYLPDFTIDE